MFKSFLRTTLAAAALAVGISAAATAAPFNLRIAPGGVGPDGIFAAPELWRNVDITIGSTSYTNFGIGLFGLQYDDDATPVVNWINFQTFCLEIDQFIDFSTPFASINLSSSTLSNTTVQQIRRMWNAHFDAATDTLASDSNDRAAAFQIALWELVDGVDGLDTGDFVLDSTDVNLLSLIDTYLTTATGNGGLGGNLNLLTNDLGQDQIFPGGRGPGGAEDPVPAPATLLLMGAALAGLGTLRNRKKG